ncbi:uncharacterized protein FA14DRAFT_51584 [Meira miltonrushii]|uniref:ZZ-type domain-containing protein n=1 Tax=Meira miltonrushii TaxID=1280837 RepID=A0A316VEN0_9BASI|nr:uncharacterized protein FA14DRAFT_51584 [Meira miltonrushii]PWN36079.1 hypothetical protein FA14DRAFT_51584 [Meira miltonrushii]
MLPPSESSSLAEAQPEYKLMNFIIHMLPVGALKENVLLPPVLPHVKILQKGKSFTAEMLESEIRRKDKLLYFKALGVRMDDMEIFFQHSPTSNKHHGTYNEVARYMLPSCDEFTPAAQHFLGDVSMVKAEVWHKDDLASPSHIYLRKDSKYPFKLQVTCTLVPLRMIGGTQVQTGPIGAIVDFSVPIGTKQCITAFRRDLPNVIARKCDQFLGFAQNMYSVEVYLKKSQDNKEIMFEDRVAQCMSNGKPLELQFALRANFKAANPSSALKAKAIPVKLNISSNVSPKKKIDVKEASVNSKSDSKKDTKSGELANQAILLDALRKDFETARENAQSCETAKIPSTVVLPPFTDTSAAQKEVKPEEVFLAWKKRAMPSVKAETVAEKAAMMQTSSLAAKEAWKMYHSRNHQGYPHPWSSGPPPPFMWPKASEQMTSKEVRKAYRIQEYSQRPIPWYFGPSPSSLRPESSEQTKAADISKAAEKVKPVEHVKKPEQEEASQALPVAPPGPLSGLQRLTDDLLHVVAGSAQNPPGSIYTRIQSEAQEHRKRRCNPSLKSSIHCQAPSLKPSSDAEAKDQGQEVGPVKDTTQHNAACNLCDKRIKGIRWKCTACIDFDVCSACKATTNSTHPFHQWMKLQATDALPLGVTPSDWVIHPNVICNGCDKAIVGPRYKCINCADFDWCHSCESNPALHHVKSEEEPHLFLKINKPLPDARSVETAKVQAKATVTAMNKRKSAHAEEIVDITLKKPDIFEEDSTEQQETQLDKITQLMDRLEKKQRKTEKRIDSFGGEVKDFNDAIEKILNKIDQISADSLNTQTNAFGDESKDFEHPIRKEFSESFLSIMSKMDQMNEDLLNAIEKIDQMNADSLNTTHTKPLTTENVRDEDVHSVRARLADLSVQAQKLPGASLVADGLMTMKDGYVVPSAPVAEEDAQSVAEDYDMQVLADITVPDGARLVAGSLFDKVWRVWNTGTKAWPEETCITSISNFANSTQAVKHSINIGRIVKAGEMTDICMPNLVVPSSTGKDAHFFRLALPSEFGQELRFFGDQLWYDIEIVNGKSSNETTKANKSTAASMHHPKPSSSDSQKQESENEMNGSSFFRAPFAPRNDRAPSMTGHQTEFLLTPTNEGASSIAADDLILLGSDEDFEIIEPSSDEESD